jgi:hypothetical protein
MMIRVVFKSSLVLLDLTRIHNSGAQTWLKFRIYVRIQLVKNLAKFGCMHG